MKHLLPLILALSACASTEAPQKPTRGTLPDWEDKEPQPPTIHDSTRNMYRRHQQQTSNVIRF